MVAKSSLYIAFYLLLPLQAVGSLSGNDKVGIDGNAFIIDYSHSYQQYVQRSWPYEIFAERNRLFDKDLLENEFFKVTEFKIKNEALVDEPLAVTDLDGRNVMYHLNRARDYFYGLDPNNPALNNKIIVRVRANHKYSYFSHSSDIEWFNDARYVSKDYRERWNSEIWFHERQSKTNWKKVAIGSIPSSLMNPLSALISLPVSLIANHSAGLDSSKNQSVIYHEAFHWATDNTDQFKAGPWSIPIAEDLANYFASSLLGLPTIAETPGFTDRRFKRKFTSTKLKKGSNPNYNGTVLVPSLLWEIRKKFGQKTADQIIWNSIELISDHPRAARLIDALLIRAKEMNLPELELSWLESFLNKFRSSLIQMDQFFYNTEEEKE